MTSKDKNHRCNKILPLLVNLTYICCWAIIMGPSLEIESESKHKFLGGYKNWFRSSRSRIKYVLYFNISLKRNRSYHVSYIVSFYFRNICPYERKWRTCGSVTSSLPTSTNPDRKNNHCRTHGRWRPIFILWSKTMTSLGGNMVKTVLVSVSCVPQAWMWLKKYCLYIK